MSVKCEKCGAPVRPMPPDGDLRFDDHENGVKRAPLTPFGEKAAALAEQCAVAMCELDLRAGAAQPVRDLYAMNAHNILRDALREYRS